MKGLLVISILSMTFFSVSAQTKGIKFGVEYSPNLTNVIPDIPHTIPGFRLAHNAFFKTEFKISHNISLTTGLGYLNARSFDRIMLGSFMDISVIESVRTHHYVVLPIGLKYNIGSFFIYPEIGLAYNLNNTTQQTTFLTNGTLHQQRFDDEFNNRDNNDFTFPLFLTIGNEFKIGSYSLLVGLKGYYSLNKVANEGLRANRYYGFGLVTGLKF